MATRISPILDPYGRRMSVNDFYTAGRPVYNNEDGMPDRFRRSYYDTTELVSNASWRQLLSSARFLFANVPIIRGALLEQAAYSLPLDPRYTGTDKAWGELAEEALLRFDENPTLRGGMDMEAVSRVLLLGWKVDGDIFTVLTEDEAGQPRIQLQRAHRIGGDEYGAARTSGEDKRLVTGPYRGQRLCNGVVIDDYSRALAYLIPGQDIKADQYVSASGMFPTCLSDYADEYRGMTSLCAAIPSMAVHSLLREYELRAMQIQSSFAVGIRNETGLPNPIEMAISSGDYGTATTGNQATLTTETLDKGMVKYFKAGTGAGLEFYRPDRPGEGWQSFEDRVIAAALFGMQWDPNFAMMIKEPGGANARIMLQKVNRTILTNAKVVGKSLKRIHWYVLNRYIEQGLLPMPADGDTTAFRYRMTLPQLTADSGNEEAAKRDAYKLGLTDLITLTTEKGQDWEEIRENNEAAVRDLLTRVDSIGSDFADLGFSPDTILNLLEMRNPNGASPAPAKAEPAESDDAPKPTAPEPVAAGNRHQITIQQAPLEVALNVQPSARKKTLKMIRDSVGDIVGAETQEVDA